MKPAIPTFVLLSILVIAFFMVAVPASPDPELPGPYVDQHWWQVTISSDERMNALLSHEVDAGPIQDPCKIPALEAAGFTITKMPRIGQILLMENNRVWPFGTPTGGEFDPENWRAVYFRKGIHRLINKDELVAKEAPLKSKADWWLPPGMPQWINPDCPVPTFDPLEAVACFNEGGFSQGTTPNPHYDPDKPWSAEYIRIDPLTGEDLEPVEYYVIGPAEDPIGFEVACQIFRWLREAGIPVDLVVGTRLGIVIRLTNPVLDDYQLMGPVPIFWGAPAPDILYDFVYSENLPLWCFSVCNYTELDYWALMMKATLYEDELKTAVYNIQECLNQSEPYLPLLLDNGFCAFTGPYGTKYPETGGWEHPGFIGIVNALGFGALGYSTNIGFARGPSWSSNVMGKMRSDALRIHPDTGVEIDMWIMPAYLETLNPLMADTEADWQCLDCCLGDGMRLNPYTYEYMWWAWADMPVIDTWTGPGGELGMTLDFTLREGITWHDDVPLTAYDCVFALNLMRFQNNERYLSSWQPIYDVVITGPYSFKIWYLQRYLLAHQYFGMSLYCPKHIWEPWVDSPGTGEPLVIDYGAGPMGGDVWTSPGRHHSEWRGWEEVYMEDPQYPGEYLTRLIGFGPYVYHLGGWEPGVSLHLEANRLWYGGRVDPGDCNLDGFTDMRDIYTVLSTFGAVYGDPDWDPAADVCFPAQEIGHGIDLVEVYLIEYHFGIRWWPPD